MVGIVPEAFHHDDFFGAIADGWGSAPVILLYLRTVEQVAKPQDAIAGFFENVHYVR